MIKKQSIAVIGTGVSGLRCAQLLAKKSSDSISRITLIEKGNTIGGVLSHTKENDFLFEHGAQGVLSSRESFLECVKDLNLESKMITPPQKRLKRYLLTQTGFKGLFPGFLILLRILCEPFVKKSNRPILNETIYDFFSRRFGKKFADLCVIPLTFGIWAGGAKKILMRYSFSELQKTEVIHGSLIKHFFYRLFQSKKKSHLCSFQNGMGSLPQALYDDLKKTCDAHQIELVTLFNKAISNIDMNQMPFDLVIYTGQPWRDDALVIGNTQESHNALSLLKSIPNHSIAVVGLGGTTSAPHLEGFGALANTWSQDILGVLSIHSLYPQHVPKNTNAFLYRVMLGGEADSANEIIKKSDTDLVSLAKMRLFQTNVLQENQTQFDFEHVVVWKNYIPLPTKYQDRVLEAIWKLEALNPGLFFSGNYIQGVSVADCLKHAEMTVEKINQTFLE